MLGYRGPFYYLLVGVLSYLGDPFLLAKMLSAVCAGIGLRLIGGLLQRAVGPTVAVAGTLFLAANPTLIQYSFRASTDLVFLALFAGTLALLFSPTADLTGLGAAGICAGLAYLTRYNGVALLPMGLVAALILVRPWKRAWQWLWPSWRLVGGRLRPGFFPVEPDRAIPSGTGISP